ncbi:MAG: hypothetical protein ACI87O_002639 [Planctomycetota bacterium]|jgi:hypothetical protein
MKLAHLTGVALSACALTATSYALAAPMTSQGTLESQAMDPAADPAYPFQSIAPGQWTRAMDPQPDGAMPLVKTPRTAPVHLAPVQLFGEPAHAPLHLQAEPSKRERLFYDVRDGNIWTRGVDYKACASEAGFSFIPFLGSSADKNYPVHMKLASARLAGQELPLGQKATVSRVKDQIRLQRGPVQVRYDMALKSVEQSFVLNAAGSEGDLEIEIAVETELAMTSTEHGLIYRNTLGSVAYEHAIVLDGKGKTLHLPIVATQGQIRLVVPASFLATACNPIIVDPVIARRAVFDVNPQDMFGVDIAYDLTTDRTAYTMYSVFSATDHDIRIETYTYDGTFFGGFQNTAWVDFTTEFWSKPAIANDNGTDTFLVTAIRENTSGYREVRGRTVAAGTLAMSPTFLIGNASSSWTNINADVGGKSQGSSMFKVVWERRFTSSGLHGIRSTSVIPTNPHSTTIAPTVASLEGVTASSTETFTKPAISKSSGQSGNAEWRVLFGSQVASSGAEALHAARYADDNSVLHAHAPLFNFFSTQDLTGWDVSEGLADVPGPRNGAPLYCAVFSMTTGPHLQVFWMGLDEENYFDITQITTREGVETNVPQMQPSIATLSGGFAISYVELLLGLWWYECRMDTIALTNTDKFAIRERHIKIAGVGLFNTGNPAGCASHFSGGDYNSREVSAGMEWDNGGEFDVQGHLVRASQLSLAGYQYCTPTPNANLQYAFINVVGNNNTVDPKYLTASQMPSNQFGYFLTSQGGSGSVVLPGNNGRFCLAGGPLGRYNAGLETFFTGTQGSGYLTIDPQALRAPNGNVAAQPGETWNFQAWYRENGGDSNFTNAVTVLFE